MDIPPLSKARGKQPATSGIGRPFTSPIRRQSAKTKIRLKITGLDRKTSLLQRKLAMLKTTPAASSSTSSYTEDDIENHPDPDWVDESPIPAPFVIPPTPARRTFPNTAATRLYQAWNALVPSLIDPLNIYLTASTGKPCQLVPANLQSNCIRSCTHKSSKVLALFYDRFEELNVSACECQSLAQVLVVHGLFPTAPSQPRIAVSVDLLVFYSCLFERSCDAVTAVSNALHTFYIRRGFRMKNTKGETYRDPFRRSFGHAYQWFDALYQSLQRKVEQCINSCVEALRTRQSTPNQLTTLYDAPLLPPFSPVRFPKPLARSSPLSSPQPSPDSPQPQNTPSPTPPPVTALTSSECARTLQLLCPACFGGVKHGRSIQECDFHVCVDGNFHHRHMISAGDSPHFFDSTYFLSKEYVDSIGARIETVRARPPKKYHHKVPAEAVDECEKSYEAADGDKVKASMDRFDDTGLMALVCRHDIPLFFANIDTPGEQQKYAVALIEHLFTLIPSNATVACLYDVGCVLDRSLAMYDILSEDITTRLVLATSAMHAYGHQWSCQLVYNPRLREGLGLSEGEGTERLWSRLRKLIGLTRTSARSRRLWLIDWQAKAIGRDLRDDLGDWILRRLHKGVEQQGMAAQLILDECGVTIPVLREQWALQNKSQLSVRSHAPARVKKELDTILTLQGDLETLDVTITHARTMISKTPDSSNSLNLLATLEETYDSLKEQVETLYTSLNISDSFPELQGLDLDFVRILLMARDLKINIRKRAIGSFFEWDKLDRASGGANPALGTKLHQQTRKAITKRKPALMTAIRKFNRYCDQLEALNKPQWNIPTPSPLPTQLSKLRDDSTLMEDVWITPSQAETPRWLEDRHVREGIRAVLKIDRCKEERIRLGIEADNLCRWFGRELAAIELALAMPSNHHLAMHLRQRRDSLLLLKPRWTNPLASAARFDAHVLYSQTVFRDNIAHEFPSPCLVWPVVPDTDNHIELEVEEDPTDDISLPAPCRDSHSLWEDIMERDVVGDEDTDSLAVSAAPNATIDWNLPEPALSGDHQLNIVLENIFHIPGNQHNLPDRRFRDITNRSRYFMQNDIARLANPTALLNDVCINEGAALLQYRLSCICPLAKNFALLSTHDLPRIRSSCGDPELWRMIRHVEYWNKEVWIIPIHRTNPDHWVVCIAVPDARRLFLFDSFGESGPWVRDVSDIMILITRMVMLANKHDHPLHIIVEDWIARPINVTAVQTNLYDCGVWVLAVIGAVLQGFGSTAMREVDMLTLRQHLHRLVLHLPGDRL